MMYERMNSLKTKIALRVFLLSLAALTLLGCRDLPDPLVRLQQELDRYPTYSVILQDMDRSGNFVKSYHHLYRIMIGSENGGTTEFRTEDTDWFEVSEKYYARYQDHLGMVVLSKGEEGQVSRVQTPPGYRYVGDSRYGSWERDSNGNEFWKWYIGYVVMRDLVGPRPIYRDDYRSYRRSYDSGRPWFGSDGKTYGTQGTQTKKVNPTFYQRQQARQASRQQSFGDKVKSRTGRSTMNRSRSRSSGRGGK